MTQYTHLTIDLETLDLKPTAKITQLGACLFNLHDEAVEPKTFMYNCVCEDKAYTTSQETIDFWAKQSDEAKQSLKDPKPIEMFQVLLDFIAFLEENKWDRSNGVVFAQGTDFDIPIFKHALMIEEIGTAPLWHYGNVRDSRTLMAMFPEVDRIQPEIKHRADHDALAQSLTMIKVQRHIDQLRKVAMPNENVQYMAFDRLNLNSIYVDYFGNFFKFEGFRNGYWYGCIFEPQGTKLNQEHIVPEEVWQTFYCFNADGSIKQKQDLVSDLVWEVKL